MSDLISRQAAIDVTTETVFVEYEDGDPRKEESIILQTKAAIRDRIKALPSVQPNHNAEPGKMVDDTVSRQAAMESLMAQNVIMDGSEYHNGFNAGVNRAQEVIKNLPPVQPKHGKWIERESGTEDKENGFETVIVCSCCDYPATTFYSEDCESRTQIRTDFCPNCGADMRGEA